MKNIPLWARNNVRVRVPPRKPDPKPLWMHANNAVMQQQKPQDVVSATLHNYRVSSAKRVCPNCLGAGCSVCQPEGKKHDL